MILLTCLIAAKQLSSYPTRENISFTLSTSLLNHTAYTICSNPQQKSCHFMTMFWHKREWALGFEMYIFNTDLLSAKLQHRKPVLTAWTVRFISAPLILTLLGRSTGIICPFKYELKGAHIANFEVDLFQAVLNIVVYQMLIVTNAPVNSAAL